MAPSLGTNGNLKGKKKPTARPPLSPPTSCMPAIFGGTRPGTCVSLDITQENPLNEGMKNLPAKSIFLFTLLWALKAYPLSFLDRFFSDPLSGDMGERWAGKTASNVEFSWREMDGEYQLLITPKGDKDVPLDIKIEDGLVKVSGKVIKEEIVERDGVKSQSSYLSQFSLAEGIPREADDTKAKITQEGQSVKITFPKISGKAKDPANDTSNLKDVDIPGDRI